MTSYRNEFRRIKAVCCCPRQAMPPSTGILWSRLFSPFVFVLLSVVLTSRVAFFSAFAAAVDTSAWPAAPTIDKRLKSDILYAAEASMIAYHPKDQPPPSRKNVTVDGDMTIYQLLDHPDFASVKMYEIKPDLIGVLKHQQPKNKESGDDRGRCVCYLTFRGTTPNAEDWLQNFEVSKVPLEPEKQEGDRGRRGDITGSGSRDIIMNNTNEKRETCAARKGFTNFLNLPIWNQAKNELKNCMRPENDGDSHGGSNGCELVLTGHSKGAAQALVAAVVLHDFVRDAVTATDRVAAKVINFGQVPVFDRECPYIDPHSVYRFVNTVYNYGKNKKGNQNTSKKGQHIRVDKKTFSNKTNSLFFDPVPFAPSAMYGDHYGYGLLLGGSFTPNDQSAMNLEGLDDTVEGNENLKYYAWNHESVFDLEINENRTFEFGNRAFPVLSRIVPGNNTDVRAHDLGPPTSNRSYYKRIQSLRLVALTIQAEGFSGQTPCDPRFFDLCKSKICDVENVTVANDGVNKIGKGTYSDRLDFNLDLQTSNQKELQQRLFFKCTDGAAVLSSAKKQGADNVALSSSAMKNTESTMTSITSWWAQLSSLCVVTIIFLLFLA